MLKRDLLCYYFRRKKFLPRFVDVGAAEPQFLAGKLLELFRDSAAKKLRQCELVELSQALVKGSDNPKLAGGLAKLLMDRTIFAPVQERDFPAWRRQIFAASGQLLTQGKLDFATYHRTLAEQGAFAVDLYGDLPDFEPIAQFRDLTVLELLNRYNIAQVQGLLLYSKQLEVAVSAPDPADLRRLLKFMKFFRLLADLSSPDKDGINLTVSGPFELFDGAQKYALQLAAFFPAVVKLPHWKLHAAIELKNQQGVLELDESSKLVSHYRNISNYIPEEIRLYHQLFAQKSPDWKIVGHAPFINAGGGEIIFPDLSFRRATGGVCHLELFHRWHRAPFEKRLIWLEKQKKYHFIAGVDRAVASDENFQRWQEKFPRAMEHVFRFRDFPGVETTLKMLRQFEV